MTGFCFVIVLFIRAYTLKRRVIRGGQQEKNKAAEEPAAVEGSADASDLEKGRVVETDADADEESEEVGEKGALRDEVGVDADVVEEKRVEAALKNSAMEETAVARTDEKISA